MKNLFAMLMLVSLLAINSSKAQVLPSAFKQDSIDVVNQFHLPWWDDDDDHSPSPPPKPKGPWGDYPTPYYSL